MNTCPKCSSPRDAAAIECPNCGIIYAKFDPARHAQLEATRAEMQAIRAVANMPVTTTHTIPGREIESVLDVVSAQCVFGANIFKDVLAGFVDLTGGRSGLFQNTLRDGRQTVIREIRREAGALGADAVVGVSLTFNEMSGDGKSMLFVVASGTAVKLKPA
jgi:uncharacterized protein YbjQ (UPF0145 family)